MLPLSSQHIFDDAMRGGSMPWLWRQLDRVAPTRRSKVALIAVTLSAIVTLVVAMRLVTWLNFVKTDRLAAWSSVDSAGFRMSLIGMTREEVIARFGNPEVLTQDSWYFRTGRREGPALGGMYDESVEVTFQNGALVKVDVSSKGWGCQQPGRIW